MMDTCDLCGNFTSCTEVDGEFICYNCQEILDDDCCCYDEPEIDYDACDRDSAAINDFVLQERY